jgi:hypothetical protein
MRVAVIALLALALVSSGGAAFFTGPNGAPRKRVSAKPAKNAPARAPLNAAARREAKEQERRERQELIVKQRKAGLLLLKEAAALSRRRAERRRLEAEQSTAATGRVDPAQQRANNPKPLPTALPTAPSLGALFGQPWREPETPPVARPADADSLPGLQPRKGAPTPEQPSVGSLVADLAELAVLKAKLAALTQRETLTRSVDELLRKVRGGPAPAQEATDAAIPSNSQKQPGEAE